jgi:transposase
LRCGRWRRPNGGDLAVVAITPHRRWLLDLTLLGLCGLEIARILGPHVAEVILAHLRRLRTINHAKVKTDKVDARVLAELLAAGLVPAVWMPDETTRRLRRQVSRRRGLVKGSTAVKNEICAVLVRNSQPPAHR